MYLSKLKIENYKCIEDSGEFRINDITCLMGKNESGKSAILEALYKLNPVEQEIGIFDASIEYPRRHLVAARKRQDVITDNVLTTIWNLNEEEVQAIASELGDNILQEPMLTITKGYSNKVDWHFPLDEKAYISSYLEQFNLNASEKSQLLATSSINELKEKLTNLASPNNKQANILQDLNKMFGDHSLNEKAKRAIESSIPYFLYFPNYFTLPGIVSLDELKIRKDKNNLRLGDKLFLALLDMTGSNIEALEVEGERERFIVELEAIKVHITDQIFEYWTQNQHLKAEFRFDPGRPNDPPPFNKGYIFNTRIENLRHRASVSLEYRSTGFVWFFSFLVWFSQVAKNYGENLILLLDEPGLSLHGKAQQDLLRYFNKKLKPKHQIIYTAHSPFMIDPENIFAIRTVEDIVEKKDQNGGTIEVIKGTKVNERVFGRDKDTVFPIQGSVGFDLAQTMFVGPYVVVVEGPTEAALFRWFASALDKRDRPSLDLRWAICPSEGASKITSFISLFHGRGLKIAAVVDDHESQRNLVSKLEKSGLLENGYLLKTSSYVDQNEADIEDLLGRSLYITLVNKALKLPDQLKIPKSKPKGVDQRVVLEIEEHNRNLPPGFPEFTHYLPVQTLIELSDKEIKELPGLDTALDRFEKLFQDLNNLIA